MMDIGEELNTVNESMESRSDLRKPWYRLGFQLYRILSLCTEMGMSR
jgi:hypothetical protein